MAEKYISFEEFEAVVHKLNNYLFIVSWKLDIIMQEDQLDQKVKDNLRAICQQVDEVKEYIDYSTKVFLENPKQEQPKKER